MPYRILPYLCLLLVPVHVRAQQTNLPAATTPASEVLEQDYVSYSASYFSRFSPATALDMVNQVPGFRLVTDINDVRGFGTAAGNILIDDRRPSTKRDMLSAILARIPAGSVERIELIRGQVRNIDMRGQSSMLNIILRAGIPAAVQWEVATRKTFGHGPFKPEALISLTDNWKGIDYNVGIDARYSAIGRKGIDNLFDGAGEPDDRRVDIRDNRNRVIKGNLNAAGWWGENFLQLNTVYHYSRHRTYTNSDRVRQPTKVRRNVFFDDIEEEPTFELGLDIERNLTDDLIGKLIFLYVDSNMDLSSTQRDTNTAGLQTLYRIAAGELVANEQIGRFEFDWTRFEKHLISFNAERVVNTLESTLRQTDDTGAGPVNIIVPGANGKVEEVRYDTLLKDTWTLDQLELDYGMGAEASTITQTGDADIERSFFFLKPQASLSWSWQNRDQTRLRLAREISQLNLEDFVSATEFVDNDIALGNPNIKPDATWKLELGHEMRFGSGAVVKATGFHHWIKDTLDFLPLSETFEAPGNIGDGSRWGILWESSLPLDWIGLRAAKLDLKARWQDSSVTDPVTGTRRVLSINPVAGGPIMLNIENKYAWEMNYRQDFRAQQFAWGWKMMERGEQYQFKADELQVYDENMDVHTYIETSRWFGVKMQFGLENILDFHEERVRTIYTGARDLTPVDSIELRDRTRGFRVNFTMSGSF